MNASELRDKLLATADALATVNFPPAVAIELSSEIEVHGVKDRAALAAWVALMTNPRRDRSQNTCWVTGRFGQIKLVVFYTAGLLGEVVESPNADGIDALLAEHAEAGA